MGLIKIETPRGKTPLEGFESFFKVGSTSVPPYSTFFRFAAGLINDKLETKKCPFLAEIFHWVTKIQLSLWHKQLNKGKE